MFWMNLVYLGSGLGMGWAIGRLRGNLQPPSKPAPANADQLAYQMAVEMGAFKGGFLARTSHELRSPLNGIIGVHQLILADLCETPAEERDFIAQANESALKMVQLLDEVIHVAKAQHGTNVIDLQPVQLTMILHEVDSMTHLLAKNRNLRLTIALPDPDLYVLADPSWLRQVLVSLIDGAIAQMQDGAIKLSVASVDSQFVHLVLEDERPPGSWQEAIDLLQSANPPQATSHGFGLMLTQTLLNAMNGRLELLKVPSVPGETQTHLRCSIPIVAESDLG
jgi:signal transduction histidine kinase